MKSLLVLLAISAANLKPADVAYLVNETDAAAIVDPLRSALASSDPLVRATAARVIGVRDEKALVADVRAAAGRESDATAAREELRAIALLGDDADVDFAIESSRKWPLSMNADVANAIARRGPEAIDVYLKKLHDLPGISRDTFFTIALWGRGNAAVAAAARLLGARDAAGWGALLRVLRESNLAVNANIAAVALDGPMEEIRNDTVWYVTRGYMHDPGKIPQPIREALANPKETASDREAFGRELIRRMLGEERKDDPRWLAWLETKEADDLLAYNEPELYALLTDREYALRKNHCGVLPVECAMPQTKPKPAGRVISPTAVRQPVFELPGPLPAGLADAVASRCGDLWLGLASVTIDTTGRVQKVDSSRLRTRCTKEVDTLLRISYAANTSIVTPLSDDVLLVRGKGVSPCLDEEAPSNDPVAGLSRVGGAIVAPKAKHKVDPVYPGGLLGSNRARGKAFIILEAVITKSGCVRGVRVMAQTPFPEINASAIYALSQWTFYPGTLGGKPVDVLYNVTINFIQ
jgi:hypothetical protein